MGRQHLHRRALRLLAAAAVVSVAGACSSPDYVDQADEQVELDASYRSAPVEAEPLERWCSDFDFDELDRLAERAFEDNLELRAAWARLEQAEAIARQQGAALWPWLSAQAGATRQKMDFSTTFGEDFGGEGGEGGEELPGGEEQQALPTSTTFTTYQASVAASYELDVWGRIRSQRDAAVLDAAATRAQAESMAMTLMSQLAENWLEMVYQRERIALLNDQIEVSERYYELTLLRLRQGEATALDVTQQRQNLEELRGQLALAESSEENARNQLAVLVGQAPTQELELEHAELPALEPTPAPGLPADLVTRRPDVRTARLQLRAADHRLDAAHAERLPQVQLSGDLSLQATEIAELFEQLLWSVSANLSQPIFEGGRINAQIDQAEGVAEEALFNYAQTLLTAIQEVQEALILEERQEEYVESLDEQMESAQRSLELARERFRRGAADYLRVLTAIQALQQTEQAHLDARRQRLSTRIRLCRALGGTWTRRLESPDAEETAGE